jgi:long-chain fatty acid transport protein
MSTPLWANDRSGCTVNRMFQRKLRRANWAWVFRFIVCGLCFALPRTGLASGFVLFDQSAAALAQGSAVVGSSTEPAANWFNPAGLAFRQTWGASATLALAYADSKFQPETGPTVNGNLKPQLVPNAFATLPVSARVHLGFGVFAPYGFAVSWPSDWQGREKAIAVNVAVIALNTNLALKLSDKWAVALGVAPIYGRVKFAIGLPSEVGSRGDLEGSAWSWQANAAVMFKALPNKLHLGATYRGINQAGRSRLHLSGPADFTATNATLAETFADQNARTTLPLPDMASLGATWWANPFLKFGLQVDYTRWSVFDRLDIEFDRPTTPRQIIERRSRDAFSVRAGVQRSIKNSAWDLRGGLSFDQSTGRQESLAPSAPDGNRVGVSLGAGVAIGRVQLDFGYLLLYFLPAKATGGLEGPQGTYSTRAHILAVTVTGAAAKSLHVVQESSVGRDLIQD